MSDAPDSSANDAALAERIAALLDLQTPSEKAVGLLVAFMAVGLLLGTAVGVFSPNYLLFLLGLAGMFALLSLGLNVQWGYAGLINFSVAAFWGVGAYAAALTESPAAPPGLELHPLVGLFVGIVAAAGLAVLIGIPTLRLRTDYLAIASLGLAEVVRLVILNEDQWTNGSAGVSQFPELLSIIPVPFPRSVVAPSAVRNAIAIVLLLVAVYVVLRHIHRSPWGRVLRTIRSDEDLAKALGRDTYRFKMEAFVVGSVVMAVAGFFYVHLLQFLAPSELEPIRTFYVWVAVILGGAGSNRGAALGGFLVVAITEGPRFLSLGELGIDVGALQLLLVGALIIAVIRIRPEGLLPPGRELIWPKARERAGTHTRGGADE